MSKYLNLSLISTTFFFLCFCWLSFYGQPLWARYCVSALLSVMLFVILMVSLKKAEILPGRYRRASTKSLKLSLATMTDFSPFIEIFKDKGYAVTPVSDSCVLLQNKVNVLIEFSFRVTNVVSQDVFNAYKRAEKLGAEKIVIFCIKTDSSAWQATRELPVSVSVFDFFSTRRFLRENDKTVAPLPTKRRKTDSSFFFFAFAKNRAKHYFGISLILLLSAVVSFYPLYNCIVATITFAIGIYALVNKRFNPVSDFLF